MKYSELKDWTKCRRNRNFFGEELEVTVTEDYIWIYHIIGTDTYIRRDADEYGREYYTRLENGTAVAYTDLSGAVNKDSSRLWRPTARRVRRHR